MWVYMFEPVIKIPRYGHSKELFFNFGVCPDSFEAVV